MYSATAGEAGQTWALTTGSMSQSKLVPLTDDAAATESSAPIQPPRRRHPIIP
jgi:hypothetical protein